MIDMSLFDKQYDIIHGDQQKYIKQVFAVDKIKILKIFSPRIQILCKTEDTQINVDIIRSLQETEEQSEKEEENNIESEYEKEEDEEDIDNESEKEESEKDIEDVSEKEEDEKEKERELKKKRKYRTRS